MRDTERPGAARASAKHAAALLAAAQPGTAPHARAQLAHGIALNRLGQGARAKAQLIDAVRAFDALGDLAGRAEALAAFGTVLGWSGDIEHASLQYSLALADWATLGNHPEIARVLVLLGRLNLEARRFSHALEFFGRARALLAGQGSALEMLRAEHYVGQCLAGLERLPEALARFDAALRGARESGLPYVRFIAARDAALAASRQGEPALAQRYLEEAREVLPEDPSAYERISLRLAQAEIALGEGRPADVDGLTDAVAWHETRELTGPEIAARMLLARALVRRGLPRNAEKQLAIALRKAQAQRLGVHAAELKAEIGRLDFSESALAEEHRGVASGGEGGTQGYVVRERLGSGAFGAVFRAFDLDNARDVALKELALAQVYAPAQRARLLASARAELEAASRVRHPGIARVYALNHTEDAGILLVQEFVAGESLRRRMERAARPALVEVVQTALPIAHALAALHGAGVVHRDLKPENVILRSGGEPVLIDFGIARIEGADSALPAIVGTLSYMAPEQARGSDVDARADLYALGVILFEWLAGRLPAPDAGALAVLRADLPEAASDLIARLLSRRRWRRPDSALEVAQRLEALRVK